MICPRCGCEFKSEARNLSQNALLHLWFSVLKEHLGYTSMEDVKRDVKREILGQKEVVNKITGLIEFEDFQTSAMTKKQMSDFMDHLKTWANSELDVYLPYYGDPGYDELINHFNK